MTYLFKNVALALLILTFSACGEPQPVELRVMTYNVEDIRPSEIADGSERLHNVGRLIADLAPDILLLNEISLDLNDDGTLVGQNGQRFADQFINPHLNAGSNRGLYSAVMVNSNTGVPSGYDLDNDGVIVTGVEDDLTGEERTQRERAYGNDSFGYGIFPGQYAMALFVREPLEIDPDRVQTLQEFKWSELPGALRPEIPETRESWYSDEEWQNLRLSSKNHWVVPVRVDGRRELYVIAAHPTPPAFDGPERRNKMRNHDEIKLLSLMIDDSAPLHDDDGNPINLSAKSFVIMGDLNADPDEGSSIDNPIGRFLLDHPRVNGSVDPRASAEGAAQYAWLDDDDTAFFRMRVDYVLPSSDLTVVRSEVHRPDTALARFSDHFPVLVDLVFE